MIEWERRKFKKMFPNIFQEIEGDIIPNVIDHLERCTNLNEAIEIIEYFEKRKEITKEYANFLKSNKTLLKSIIGSRKPGKYEKEGLR